MFEWSLFLQGFLLGCLSYGACGRIVALVWAKPLVATPGGLVHRLPDTAIPDQCDEPGCEDAPVWQLLNAWGAVGQTCHPHRHLLTMDLDPHRQPRYTIVPLIRSMTPPCAP
jgi:hypothetical protein